MDTLDKEDQNEMIIARMKLMKRIAIHRAAETTTPFDKTTIG